MTNSASAPLPPDEQRRLEILREYAILDTPPEEVFDELTTLAAHICEAPISLISLIDEDRQWVKSDFGFGHREPSRAMAFCAHAIERPDTFVVPDARNDTRFATNPLVTAAPHVRFYAGAPLVSPEGHAVGTLCVIDQEPRELQPDQELTLRILARHVMTLLEQRRRTHGFDEAFEGLEAEAAGRPQSELDFETLARTIPHIVWGARSDGAVDFLNQRGVDTVGRSAQEIQGWGWLDALHPEDQAESTRRWEHSLATGEPFEAEYRLQIAGGATWRWHLVRALPRRDAAGHVDHWYGTTTDIHELRETQASLEAARADLEHRVQERTEALEQAVEDLSREVEERRSSEAIAKRERDLSEEVINSLPGIFYLHDEDRHMLRWNRNFETVTGHTAEEVASLDTLEILREDDRDLLARSIRGVFASGNGEVEATIVSTDGREHPYYLSGRRIELDGHNCLIGMGIDISARRQAEIERDRLFELSPDLFCILGQDGYFRQLNPSWERTLGYSTEELLERPYIDFLHPEDRSATERVRQQAEAGMPVHGFENRYRCRDGSWKWLSWNTTRDPVSGMIYGAARDVTSEKAVTEALSHSEERFRGLVESAQDAIFTLSPDGILTSMNPASEVLLARSPEAFIGQPFQPFVHPEDVARAEERFEAWLRGESLPPFELRLLAADGSAVPTELTVTALRVGEDIVGALGIARDIRERLGLEEQLRRIQKLDSIGRLAAGIAHDFNNLLTVQQASLSMLFEETLPQPVMDDLADIADATERATALTRQLLLFSRNQAVELIPVDLNEIIGTFGRILGRILGEDVTLKFDLDGHLPTVEADPGMIEQVLMNLAVNARDAMPGGGRLEIASSAIVFDATATHPDLEARSGRFARIEPPRVFRRPFCVSQAASA